MKKLLQFLDNYLLKIGVSLVIAFIPLYPKLPSIAVSNTWVYIRLEDFLITAVVVIWFIQLLRKKVSIPIPLSIPFAIYWFIGLCSLIFSILFIGPHLANFFPKIAALQYARRIEYMILFFVGFSSVRNKKDIRDYLIILSLTIVGVLLYGLGQRFYLPFWAAFPDFARQFPFCFPSFQTGNEEFAKGIPLCLPQDARITSTFGGHYDLAAYLVVIIPVIVGIFAMAKKFWVRILSGIVSVGSIMLLIFTASRISFAAYIIGTAITLIFLKRKRYILPILIISFILLGAFSGSLAKRFLETIRFTSIVTNNQGQVVGVDQSTLPADLQNKIAKNSAIEANVPTQNLPTGSSFITLPSAHTPVATSVAVVKTKLTAEQIKRLNLANGGVELSTVSGNFLVQKALVYDISFTTRFQGEWPNAWAAFMRNPALGSGYSSITLAADNDYLRTLGESGFLGLGSFLFIFIFFGILLKETVPQMKDANEKGLVLGLSGGVIGLFINASLIDVFEASKVAESLWILLGIGAGSIFFYTTKKINYIADLKTLLTSKFFVSFYLVLLVLIVFVPSITNFFVSSDFTLLHTAASSTIASLRDSFMHPEGTSYQPLAQLFHFFLFTFFAFYPQGYHLVSIILLCSMAIGVYLLSFRLFNKKLISVSAAVLFSLFPTNSQNVFWISSLQISLASTCVLFSIVSYIKYRDTNSWFSYLASLVLAVFTHEIVILLPFLILLAEYLCVKHNKQTKTTFMFAIPYFILLIVYIVFRVLTHSAGIPDLSSAVLSSSYIVSIIFALIINYLLSIVQKYFGKGSFMGNIVVIFFIVVISVICIKQITDANIKWNAAGKITYNLLSTFRIDYEDIPLNTPLYFIAVPQQLDRVPVFNTGLQDSLWFIYRDNTRKIHTASTIEDAKNQAAMENISPRIFNFDTKGTINKIQ
ncbi:MAG TPA: hypothetical protein VLG12_01720 [Candidatus Saccharimonadales bacterium]|nr:hypothetical protein [Candidatus Saccharimonadales bacterium]